MTDDKNKRHPQDGIRVDINDPNEIRNWCKSFGVNEEQLKACVKKVGVMSMDVKKCLGK